MHQPVEAATALERDVVADADPVDTGGLRVGQEAAQHGWAAAEDLRWHPQAYGDVVHGIRLLPCWHQTSSLLASDPFLLALPGSRCLFRPLHQDPSPVRPARRRRGWR